MGHHNSADEFVSCLREKIEVINQTDFHLDIVGDPWLFDYSNFFSSELDLPVNHFFPKADGQTYRNLFEGDNRPTAWGVELLLERAGGRLLRLIHFSSEALKSLWYHSGEGRRSPTVIASIQTGQMELPEGPLARMLSKFSKRPMLWVRGYWADRCWPNLWEESWRDRANSQISGKYAHEVQRYGHWNPTLGHPENLPVEQYLNPEVALVKAFTEGPLKTRLRDEVQCSNGRRSVNLYRRELDPSDDGRTKIVTRRVRERWAQLGFNVERIKAWEDFGLKTQSSLSQALRVLESNPGHHHHYAIIPIGYEDEGFRLENFLHSDLPPVTLDVHFTQELDYADLRGWRIDKC